MTKTNSPVKNKTTSPIKPKDLPQKIILKKSDIEIKEAKVDNLISMLNSYEYNHLTFWKDKELGMGDIIGSVPITRTTKKTIGGQFNPHDVVKDEEFIRLYIIEVPLTNIKSTELSETNERKRTYLIKKGILYINLFDINDIYDYIVGNI